MQARIYTGTYNCADYKVIKEYSRKGSAIKFLKSIGYTLDVLMSGSWTNEGTKYTLTISE